mgnify:CR=1 FL=1
MEKMKFPIGWIIIFTLIIGFLILNNVYVIFNKVKLGSQYKCEDGKIVGPLGFGADCGNKCYLSNDVEGWNTRKVRGIDLCEKEITSESLISSEEKPFCICKETLLSRYIKPLFS